VFCDLIYDDPLTLFSATRIQNEHLLFNEHINQRTYIKLYIKTFKIAPTCFDPKITFRELHAT